MNATRKLWASLAVLLALSFGVLLWIGADISRNAPPMTERPGSSITYTNNWPSEPLIGNRPPASTYLWSACSVLFLIAGIALLGWHHAVTHGRSEEAAPLPATDPLALVRVTSALER